MNNFRIILLSAVTVLGASVPCRADLLGTNVLGSLSFGTATNYYDPVNGHAGTFLNQAGTTVTIGGGTEFGFVTSTTTITADFADDVLTLTDNTSAKTAVGWTQTFTDDAFTKLHVTFVTAPDAFASQGLLASLVGDTLTITYTGTTGNPNLNVSYVFDPPVPEPALPMLLIVALGALGIMARRFKPASA